MHVNLSGVNIILPRYECLFIEEIDMMPKLSNYSGVH